jgi:molybdenum storage protein
LVKDVDGLYDRDPKQYPTADFIREISVTELRKRELETLPFERILLDLLDHARLIKQFQVINGRKPERIIRALEGEHVGTIVYAD